MPTGAAAAWARARSMAAGATCSSVRPRRAAISSGRTRPWSAATVAALQGLVRPEEIAARRGLTLEQVAPAAMLRARAQAAAGA